MSLALDDVIARHPTGPLHLVIANLRASANYAACTGCGQAMRECRQGDESCCEHCEHPLSAADVRHATDEMTAALTAMARQEAH